MPDRDGRATPVDMIAALATFRRALEDPSHRRLFDLWHGKANPPQLPGRRDFAPFELDFALPNLVLLDVLPEPQGRFRFQLVGGAICEIFGADPTGLELDEAPAGITAALDREACARVVATTLPVAAGRTLLLPLAENGRDIDTLMACITVGPRPVAA